MTNPLNSVVEQDYARFNLIYDAACEGTEIGCLNLQLEALNQIQTQISTNILDCGAEVPKGKFTNYESLDRYLVARITDIRSKIRRASDLVPFPMSYGDVSAAPRLDDGLSSSVEAGLPAKREAAYASPTLFLFPKRKGPSSADLTAFPATRPPSPPKINYVVKGKVGFGNKGANCSFNAVLQLLLHTPEHRAILQTVGEFYAKGGSFDEIISQRVIAHFEGPVSEERMEQGVELFNSIESSFYKIKTLQALAKTPEIVQELIPESLQEQVATKMSEGLSFQEALKGLSAKRKRNDADCEAGEALLRAISAYDDSCRAGKPISPDVSQDVRMAFRHLYGAEIFSDKPVHQDIHEVLGCLMGSFEAIARCADLFPKTHAHMQTRRTFSAVGEPRTADPKMINRTKIEDAGLERAPEYQIVLHLNKKDPDGITMEELVKRFFDSTRSDDGTAAFINEDGQEQDYAVERTERMFLGTGAPPLLTVVISRNAYDKITKNTKLETIVKAGRFMTLPKDSTALGAALSYELESFSTHYGTATFGHYITYRNIEGDWVEFDDDKPQMRTRDQIDFVLNGSLAYVLNYRLSEQAALPTASSSSSSSSSSASSSSALKAEKENAEKIAEQEQELSQLKQLIQSNPSLVASLSLTIARLEKSLAALRK